MTTATGSTPHRRGATRGRGSACEHRHDHLRTLLRRLTRRIHDQVVLDAVVDHIDLRTRFADYPVPASPLPFLEYLDRCDDADEEPLEVRQLVTPSIEPVGVDEYVIDQHIVPGTCKGSNGCPHS